MWLDFDVRDNRRWTFSLEEALLWITDLYFSRKRQYEVKNVLLDLFQLLSSQDIKWWTGVVWMIVMFLSAVWTLILTAPIHCRASIGETVMQCYIYIYAFSRRFYPKRLTLHSSYSFTFDQLLLSLGIEPMILALLAPCSTIWATGKLVL